MELQHVVELGTALAAAVSAFFGGRHLEKRRSKPQAPTNPLGVEIMEAIRKLQNTTDTEVRLNAKERGRNEVFREQLIAQIERARQTSDHAWAQVIELLRRGFPK